MRIGPRTLISVAVLAVLIALAAVFGARASPQAEELQREELYWINLGGGVQYRMFEHDGRKYIVVRRYSEGGLAITAVNP